MNQIMRVGSGVLIACPTRVPMSTLEHMQTVWRERFPDIPMVVIAEAEIVQMADTILFEFNGHNLDPTVVDEFRQWWEEVNRGS